MTPFADDCRFDLPAVSASRAVPRCADCGDILIETAKRCSPCTARVLESPHFRVEALGDDSAYPYGRADTFSAAVTLAQKNAADFGQRFAVRRFVTPLARTGEVVFTTPEES